MRLRQVASVPVAVLLIMALAVSAVGMVKQAGADNGGRPLKTDLTGAAEVPGPGDPDGSGAAKLNFNADRSEICYKLTVNDIAPATGAHIHIGSADVAGPVVQGLMPPTDGMSKACVVVSSTLFSAILANPANYYVNVHNAQFPAGAVRGQLGE